MTGMSPALRVIIKTSASKKLLSLAPKDGHLYGIDLASGDVCSTASR